MNIQMVRDNLGAVSPNVTLEGTDLKSAQKSVFCLNDHTKLAIIFKEFDKV